MSKDRDKIYEIALESRRWAESVQKKYPQRFKKNLSGLCAIASAHLFKKLSNAQFNPQFGYVRKDFRGHVFVLCQGYIIDITASQYDIGRKVVVAKKTKKNFPKAYWPFNNKKYEVLEDLHELELEQSIWSDELKFTNYTWDME